MPTWSYLMRRVPAVGKVEGNFTSLSCFAHFHFVTGIGHGHASILVPMKRQNSVWVGNMSFKTTQEDLRSFFGEVGEVTRINMPRKRAAGPSLKPENRGYVVYR